MSKKLFPKHLKPNAKLGPFVKVLAALGVLVMLGILLLFIMSSLLGSDASDNSNQDFSDADKAYSQRMTRITASEQVANNAGNNPYPCINNVQDICKHTPSIDYWPGGSEGVSNPAYVANPNGNIKEIMGRITSQSGTDLILTTTSGRVFTIKYPLDTVADFNTNRAPNYHLTVGVGDAIFVTYSESLKEQSTTIRTDQIERSSLILATTESPKTGSVTKY